MKLKGILKGNLEPVLSVLAVLIALVVFIIISLNLTGERDDARKHLAAYKYHVQSCLSGFFPEWDTELLDGNTVIIDSKLEEETVALIKSHFKAIENGDQTAYDATLKKPNDDFFVKRFEDNSYSTYDIIAITYAGGADGITDGGEGFYVGVLTYVDGKGKPKLYIYGVIKDGDNWVIYDAE